MRVDESLNRFSECIAAYGIGGALSVRIRCDNSRDAFRSLEDGRQFLLQGGRNLTPHSSKNLVGITNGLRKESAPATISVEPG